MTRQVVEVVDGIGLHGGCPARVVLTGRRGPVTLRAGGHEASLDGLQVASTARATTVRSEDGRLLVGTVEHAFAALAGLGVHAGVSLAIEGPEFPLLDGGARRWCDAVARLGITPGEPALRVARAEIISAGPSRYEFIPGPSVEVEVRVDFADARIAEHASWAGDPVDFRERIAPARTFAFAHEIEELTRRGLARHVDPTSVVLVAPDAVHCSGSLFTPDEPARHKLLDLMGDLYLFGGPPVGKVRAFRPGHAANARAIRAACDRGVLVRRA